MANFLRLILGLFLLPACWGISAAFADSVVRAAESHGGFGVPALALLGGMVVFVLSWMMLPHPVKTYVFGHEMTHALWGLLFGARPSRLRVGEHGGSVRLTKTNVFITLAPYFFPFYTFVVSLVALIVRLTMGRLPWFPFWMFLIGITWAFHVLFTLETLAQRQPDVKLYGRIFSWTFIYCANLLLVMVWMTVMTPLTFTSLGHALVDRIAAAYLSLGAAVSWLCGLFAQK